MSTLNAIRRALPGLAALTLAACLPSTASAYVGPGAGLTLIGSILAIGAAVLIMVVGLVAFPIRMMMKASRNRKASKAQSGETPAS